MQSTNTFSQWLHETFKQDALTDIAQQKILIGTAIEPATVSELYQRHFREIWKIILDHQPPSSFEHLEAYHGHSLDNGQALEQAVLSYAAFIQAQQLLTDKANAYEHLLRLCNEWATLLKKSPGDLLYNRYEKADLLDELLEKLGFEPSFEVEPIYPQQAIVNIWSIEDILDQREDLTTEQARDVLAHLQKYHDAAIGINWEVIDTVANDLFPQEN